MRGLNNKIYKKLLSQIKRKPTVFFFCRTAFNEMNLANKEQTIRQNLEQLITDIPAYIEMVENVANSFDEKIGWKEFKFCFKLATSQIVMEMFFIYRICVLLTILCF